jgi:DNA-binding MarR family transcriptional regulator
MTQRPPRGTRVARPLVLGSGFLLAQLGAHAASSFAQRIAAFGVTPPQVGLLRAIGDLPGRSQQTLADEFGLPPSRMVSFIDDLESRDLVERRRDPGDRRVHLIHLSTAGEKLLEALAGVAQQAEHDLFEALNAGERRQLAELLQRVVDQQGLTRGVHPGYSRLRDGRVDCPPSDLAADESG